jgi:hypothetical protein
MYAIFDMPSVCTVPEHAPDVAATPAAIVATGMAVRLSYYVSAGLASSQWAR